MTTEEQDIDKEVAKRKKELFTRFDKESAQGILPFTSDLYFEQSNSIIRSGVFSVSRMGAREDFSDWTPVISTGSTITYRGPALTVDHEQVLGRMLVLARGRSLTKPVCLQVTNVLKWLGLKDTGPNYSKCRKILDDLSKAELRIANRQVLKRLYDVMTRSDLSELPDGKFFKEYIHNRYSERMQMIASDLQDESEGTQVEVGLRFVERQDYNNRTRRLIIYLDPIMALFFDGVNTTLVPFEVLDQVDRFGKRLLPFIASHRAGVFPLKLQTYFELSGSTGDYSKSKRPFKHKMKKRFEEWEKSGWIESGWEFYVNNEGEDMVKGLKTSDAIRLRSELVANTLQAEFIEEPEPATEQ
jgi:hypothetical protein